MQRRSNELSMSQATNKKPRQALDCSGERSGSTKEHKKKVRLIIILSAILAAAVIGSFAYSTGLFREGPVMLVIQAKGQDVVCKPLGEIPDGTIPVEGVLGTTTLEIKEGKVHVLNSPCKNHICMNTGWISNPGQIIVCLPNEVVIRLVKN